MDKTQKHYGLLQLPRPSPIVAKSNHIVLQALCCLHGLSPAPNSSVQCYRIYCLLPLAQEGVVREARRFTLSSSEPLRMGFGSLVVIDDGPWHTIPM